MTTEQMPMTGRCAHCALLLRRGRCALSSSADALRKERYEALMRMEPTCFDVQEGVAAVGLATGAVALWQLDSMQPVRAACARHRKGARSLSRC